MARPASPGIRAIAAGHDAELKETVPRHRSPFTRPVIIDYEAGGGGAGGERHRRLQFRTEYTNISK